MKTRFAILISCVLFASPTLAMNKADLIDAKPAPAMNKADLIDAKPAPAMNKADLIDAIASSSFYQRFLEFFGLRNKK
ncbi:MAG: hypothetical protein Q4B94_04075 [Pseudomonadota bacterium]|nr:hypothetical protein [Pseudomonadota bacterium]